MAKAAPDAMIDGSLDYVALSTRMILCNAQPTTYTEANATFALADVTMAGGDFTKANGDTSGRKVTMAAKSAVTVDTTGSGTHVALVQVADTTLRYVTTCPSTSVTAAGTVDFGSWKIEIADPT